MPIVRSESVSTSIRSRAFGRRAESIVRSLFLLRLSTGRRA